MAGTLNVTTISGVSTLNAPSGVLATQNGMTGVAKAWVNFNGVTTATIRGSFNTSSITRNSAGNYTMNFTTAMPNANYASIILGGAEGQTQTPAALNTGAYTTSAFSFAIGRTGVGPVDTEFVSVAILSS
jgi:hypothetical protein